MLKIAITLRKKDDHMTFFMNETYYQFLCSYFDIQLVVPRLDHQYLDIVQNNDALLICGGNDIDPYYYHQPSHISNIQEDQLIETMDFALLQQFYHAHKPIIGICRGIQVINVFFRGSLYQDIPTQSHTTINHQKQNHIVNITPATYMYRYFPSQIKVNSFHHQNIKEVSPLLRTNALSEDGFIEGVENHQVIAVQWHPERMDSLHQKQFLDMIIDFITTNKNSNY